MIQTTRYYREFLRYYEMAKHQQEQCNLGGHAHWGTTGDELMDSVYLYDVVERKYAGFTQILHDILFNTTDSHPYALSIQNTTCTDERAYVTSLFANKWRMPLEDELYLFLVHRLTGSAINYAKTPSGYHNTILPEFANCKSIEQMAEVIRNWDGGPFYTSVGYQFPSFPKPEGDYKRGGDYFLCEMLPDLARELAAFLIVAAASGTKPTFRETGEFMFNWNKTQGLKRYAFQYAAVLADIADFLPHLIDGSSLFYYGTNALECIGFLGYSSKTMKREDLADGLLMKLAADTGGKPYDLEDVACDFIRYMENYVKPGGDYGHLDLDEVFNSSYITDHPYGRQRNMLEFNLIDSFNDLAFHPSDSYVLSEADIDEEVYAGLCAEYYGP